LNSINDIIVCTLWYVIIKYVLSKYHLILLEVKAIANEYIHDSCLVKTKSFYLIVNIWWSLVFGKVEPI